MLTEKFSDVHDKGGKKLLRAKYIGRSQWLVYGNDFDTCGAVVRRADDQYVAFRRGDRLGADRTIERAIARCLTGVDFLTFIGP